MKYIVLFLTCYTLSGCCIYHRTRAVDGGKMHEIGIASLKSAEQAVKNIEE